MLTAIRDFFGQTQLTVQLKRGHAVKREVRPFIPFYFLEMRNIKVMELVVNHCVNYPLLGHKYYQLAVVMQKSTALSHLRHHFLQ